MRKVTVVGGGVNEGTGAFVSEEGLFEKLPDGLPAWKKFLVTIGYYELL